MRFLDDIFGNQRQKSYFSSLIREGKLSHAYILEAPAGCGKKTFARLLAASLAFCASDDGEREKKCRRILEGTSPDVMMLTREEGKRTIGVEAVRDFCASVYLTPAELDFKMYIFDEADRITPQAQNALLKIIEEPPHGVFMILLCENVLSLLSTVRSRAQKIALEIFDPETLRLYAKTHSLIGDTEPEKTEFALRMAGGSIGKLKLLLSSEDASFAAFAAAKKTVEYQLAKGRGVTYFSFLGHMERAASTREALDVLTGYLLQAYGDLLRMLHSDQPILRFYSDDEAERLSYLVSDDMLSRCAEACASVRHDMQFNTSLSLTAAHLAMALWKAS